MKKSSSIYIHWPFCLSLCPYCDFNSYVMSDIDHNRWLNAYKKELEYFTFYIKNCEIKSIFFGGGTPSLMNPIIIEKIIDKIVSIGGLVLNSCEITLEINPTSFEVKKLEQFKSAGINRVSIGVQSFSNENLLTLQRKHSYQEVIFAIKCVSKIFSRYSFDLIFGLPNQTLKKWQEELKFALSLAGSHISVYQLTIEKGTEFFNLFRQKKLFLPEDDLLAELFEWTRFYLEDQNYHHYEISNYAKSGNECTHNLRYWNYDQYLGIGPGAHSRVHDKSGISAIRMHYKPNKWLSSVEFQGNGVQSKNKLSHTEIAEELIMMGTRLSCGVKEQCLEQLTKSKFINVLNCSIVNEYIKQNLINISENTLKLTTKGFILHNYLIPRLLCIY